MNILPVKYKINAASLKEINIHLLDCNDNFVPPLSESVNIGDYSRKIYLNAIRFEAFINNKLVGCVAAYFNNEENKTAYITNVSVLKKHMGSGIGTNLLKMSIEYAKNHKIYNLSLEVNKNNKTAIELYKKHNFIYQNSSENSLIMNLRII